ncbi:hypothetical protein HYPSUDRAFT_44687 [Hypholoma sublateritium FD-334 SS-4]|uniref:F-box domain-containing protein n=1 Tax=Hypholoma sublateritium (strain FD-334 SS-4) TaxID=945553 RepID=A0A0D2M705_HYPSF|nr:hypothetical protein HYPSUDRAFT_44687 [Hypholoma sublateritium FD-334 SS-4]
MDQETLSSDSALHTLLKTNRPPTDQETAIIRESMAPAQAKLKDVETQISDTVEHIQALKAQVEQAEIKLQRLREEEAAILETFADHRRVFSPFRNLPEDVLREICIACVKCDMPTLKYRGRTPLPYVLAQISSGLRNIALTTPRVWASMKVWIGGFFLHSPEQYHQAYSILAQKASKWFERAGSLALTVSIEDFSFIREGTEDSESDHPNILFDALLSCSTRWKELQFASHCTVAFTPMLRIAALTAVDVPLLKSVSLCFDNPISDPVFLNSEFLSLPSLRHVTLQTWAIREFTINWAVLASVTLRGITHLYHYYTRSEIAGILQQTKCLEFCDITVGSNRSGEHISNTISLPFLKTFILDERLLETTLSGTGSPSILDEIIAPILEIFDIRHTFHDLSLTDFLKRSPQIAKLCFPYFGKDKSLTDAIRFLRLCPSLTTLSVQPGNKRWVMASPFDADYFLRAFVEEGDAAVSSLSDAGVLCPRLQTFDFKGNVNFSLKTLRLFFEAKHGENAAPYVSPWKKVLVYIKAIKETEIRQQIFDLVSQKQAAGLDVEVVTVE